MLFQFIKEMSKQDWIIFSTTICSYFFILWAVWKTDGKGQSFFTWILWLALDIVLFVPTIQKGGLSALLIAASILGSIPISIMLYRMKKKEFETSEWLSTILLIITAFIWWKSSDKNTVIACAVMAQVFAGIPLTKKSWKEPMTEYLPGYLFFTIGCILSITFENNVFQTFVLEDHLFPIALGGQTIIDICPLFGKFITNHLP